MKILLYRRRKRLQIKELVAWRSKRVFEDTCDFILRIECAITACIVEYQSKSGRMFPGSTKISEFTELFSVFSVYSVLP
jgi:hypothetical protein